MQLLVRLLSLQVATILFAFPALAQSDWETVKYRDNPVPLSEFQCDSSFSSSFVNRICIDDDVEYVVVMLSGTNYHYCDVPVAVFEAWLAADSKGRFYNRQIKSSSNGGLYDCRGKAVPGY